MLWHSGPPGSRKTSVIGRTVLNLINRARHHKNLAFTFYFCDLYTPGVRILRSLICQLLDGNKARINALISARTARMATARKRDITLVGIDMLATNSELVSSNMSISSLLTSEDVTVSLLCNLL
jgi:hypothetical protein